MEEKYIAHVKDNSKDTQSLLQHSINTGILCRSFSIPQLKDLNQEMGLLHDIGKYQLSFQNRIRGANIKVEHSICGAQEIRKKYHDAVALMMELCIAGHHGGIPDCGFPNDTEDMPTLEGRLKRKPKDDFSAYENEIRVPENDHSSILHFLLEDCNADKNILIDKFAFFTRYCYSCLTDADSIDTSDFCNGIKQRSMNSDFDACLQKINYKLSGFVSETELQKARAKLQNQVFNCTDTKSDIYLMNMPTGSGKTLCSMKFALERLIKTNKKRIIYIIPYNSIIDQTVEEFERIFGDSAAILRHQSTFSYDDREDITEDYRQTIKYASENWNAGIVITTAVQFFESVFSNRKSKLRKLHNMADSILVFDEAHTMPVKYLQPCLEAVAFITRYLNSEAVFLTATMPDFRRLICRYALPASEITDLISDTSAFGKFAKCKYQYIGAVSDMELLDKAEQTPSSLVIVNKRKTARRLYALCTGKKYHLSTYMAAIDRMRTIQTIKKELKRLREDYPKMENVPEDRRITVISTSLAEAGIDLDFYTVFRQIAGLDSILQAGGRCNREGRRKNADVFVFACLDDGTGPSYDDGRSNIASGLMREYVDISAPDCIKTYYERLFFMKEEDILSNALFKTCDDLRTIPFRTYADQFELIDSKTVSVIVDRDEESHALIEAMRFSGSANIRKLQKYAFNVYCWEFEALQEQHVIDDFGTGVPVLTNSDYYDENIGIMFEAKDYII